MNRIMLLSQSVMYFFTCRNSPEFKIQPNNYFNYWCVVMQHRHREYGNRLYRVIINILTLYKIYSKRGKVTYNNEIDITQGRCLNVLSVTWGGGRDGGSPLSYPTNVKTTINLTENFK
jgi:hypothetical protein